jgi:hypothetical protein
MAGFAAGLLACAAFSASAEEPHRQLGAHVHGHGRLNIAMEGKKLTMELEVPGADIVGFENEPSTPEQRAAIAEAKAKLANGLALFVPPAEARCELEEVRVSTEAEYEDEHSHHEGAAGDKEGEEHRHSEFHVTYTAGCRALPKLTSLTFEYFKVFPGAQELDIAVISPKGQSSFEVKRDKPNLDLTGIM